MFCNFKQKHAPPQKKYKWKTKKVAKYSLFSNKVLAEPELSGKKKTP